MLRSLHLQGFKCFASLDLALAPLTVLSGTNSSGKSSVIQALVLLAQNFEQREWSRSLMLQGPDLALGTAADVLHEGSGRGGLVIGVGTDDAVVHWSFAALERRAFALDLVGVTVNGAALSIEADPIQNLIPLGAKNFGAHLVVTDVADLSWITAERLGPREIMPLGDPDSHRKVGPRGDLAAGLLHWFGEDPVAPELCMAGVPQTLFHQVRARMAEFFPGCDLRVQPVEGANAITLRFRSSNRTEFHRPQNVGFGITQLFPVIVALLSVKRHALGGGFLLVENPEVHLHPAAQQQIGRLIGLVAATGVQVLMETHSDHVLNGVRLAVKDGELTPSDVAIHFFTGGAAPISPTIDRDGRLDQWPDGFFDQFDIALSRLM